MWVDNTVRRFLSGSHCHIEHTVTCSKFSTPTVCYEAGKVFHGKLRGNIFSNNILRVTALFKEGHGKLRRTCIYTYMYIYIYQGCYGPNTRRWLLIRVTGTHCIRRNLRNYQVPFLTVYIHVSMYPSIHYRHILVPLCLCIHVFVYLFIHVSRIRLSVFLYTNCVYYMCIHVSIYPYIYNSAYPYNQMPMYLHSCNRVSMYPHICSVYLCALLSQVVLI
jgi:hypothetical protein